MMRFYALLCAAAAALSISVLAHAETVAEKVFGKWERVSVAEILKPVPEWQYVTPGGYGSATNEYRRKPEPVKPCPIGDEKGGIIGYIESCGGRR